VSFYIKKLSLTQFRSYTAARLSCDSRPVVLTGPNGAGKTNILEAISMLIPGRGLRRARLDDLKNIKASPAEYWALAATLDTPDGDIRIGTGQKPGDPGRIIRINGIDQHSQAPLGEVSAVIWLTPQMDGLFLDSPSVRRRFLDRMVASFDPKHQSRTSRYDKLVRERAALLKSQKKNADPVWLTTIESQIAEIGIAIAAARHIFRQRLEQAINRLNIDEADFPKPRVEIQGNIDDYLNAHAAIDAERYFANLLQESREQDSYTGGARDGTHKSDFRVYHKGLGIPADNCSTGEQKGLLINLILAQAFLIKAERGFPPLLLLDDIAAHLDDHRRDVLFEAIIRLDCQCWMTGTDRSDFDSFAEKAQYIDIRRSTLQPHTNT